MSNASPSSPREAALAYAAAGFPVHPVDGKRPLTKWKDSATTDPATIAAWFERWPHAGVALVTGERSGLFVVDLDIDKDTGECTGEAEAVRLGLAECFADAPKVRTQSGGIHVFFRAGDDLDNSASKIAAAIDTRGKGGFVVAAGSPGYQWLGSSIVDCAPPPVPAKLRAAIEASKATPAEPSNVVHLSPMQALARQLARPTAGSSNAWAEQALNAEIGRVMAAGPGSRNHVLNRASFSIGQIVAGGGLERAAAEEALARAGRAIGLDAEEITKTIASGFTAGAAEPRSAPERTDAAFVRSPFPAPSPQEVAAARASRAEELLGSVIWADEIEVAPFSPYLVKRWLDRGTVSVLYGPSNVGKSFLALDLARAVAIGEPWHGRRVQGGGVIYFIAEGTTRFPHRVAALDVRPKRLAVVPRPLDLFGEIDAGAVAELVAALRDRIGDTVLMIFDTYARNAGEAEENSAKDVSRVLNHVADIQRDTGAHVMLVSHMGKDEGRGLRGSSAIKGAVDHMIEVTREGDVILANAGEKQRDEARGDLVFPYRLEVVELGADQDGEKITSCRVLPVDPAEVPAKEDRARQPSQKQRAVLDALRQYIDDHGRLNPGGTGWPEIGKRRVVEEEAFKRFAAEKQHGDTAKQRMRAVRDALVGLESKGLIASNEGHLWIVPREERTGT